MLFSITVSFHLDIYFSCSNIFAVQAVWSFSEVLPYLLRRSQSTNYRTVLSFNMKGCAWRPSLSKYYFTFQSLLFCSFELTSILLFSLRLLSRGRWAYNRNHSRSLTILVKWFFSRRNQLCLCAFKLHAQSAGVSKMGTVKSGRKKKISGYLLFKRVT